MGGDQSKTESTPEEVPDCNCDTAAEAVTQRMEAAVAGGVDAARSSVVNTVIEASGGGQALRRLAQQGSSLSQEIQEAVDKWKVIQPTTVESFQNNNGVMNYIREAIQTRHKAFKHEANFSEECKNNSEITINAFLREEKKDLDKLLNYYKTFLSDYRSLYQYKSSVGSIINNKNGELDTINNKIDNYKNSLFVDNRKNTYQQNNFEFYKTIYFYLLIFYYGLFVVYLIFSKFITEKMYTNKLLLFVIVLYLILPIILKYILNLIVFGYNYFLEVNNIKEDTKTYEDMINNKTK